MPKTETVDKFFGAVNEAYDALLDAVKSANDRGYRVSRKLIDEVERGQREALDLTRKVATSPRDVSGFYASAVRNVTDAQGRTLELTRQFLDEIVDSQREGRDTVRKVVEANRKAGQAAIEATRDAVTRTTATVEAGVNGVRARATGARRTARRETSDTKN
jgi:hypothetical protein